VQRRRADGAVKPLVLIPSYNTGPRLVETVAEAVLHDVPVWVVVDGTNDGSADNLAGGSGLRVIRRGCNGGKGQAVLDGLRAAMAEGFTHALVMDADGQHPAAMIPEFLALSRLNPGSMILGVPVFDHTAPWLRVVWRRVSNVLANLETGGAIGDSLFGFRVYPVAPLLDIMVAEKSMRRFDFDAEAAVRLSWRGVRAINRAVPVRYFCRQEGGVSHFRYGRDNALLAGMHARLIAQSAMRRLQRKAPKRQKNFDLRRDLIPALPIPAVYQKFFGYFSSKK
jgi:glycosyltransferase involved in cell wall biosynthesis